MRCGPAAAAFSGLAAAAACETALWMCPALRACLSVADPTIDTHVCEVYAEGAFGKFSFKEDVEISEHRKTGKIVAMAVAKTVKQLVSPLVVGT